MSKKLVYGQPLKIGPVLDDKASWSPANVEKSETGWQLLRRTTSVTLDNVDEKICGTTGKRNFI